MVDFSVNGQKVSVQAPADKPLLWVLRDELKLTGTKFGCGVAQCGACTVHINGQPTRSCVLPISTVAGADIMTIEGLVRTDIGKRLYEAWIDHQVPQCGYCQSGQLMTAANVIAAATVPLVRAHVLEKMQGNLCRCATYNQIASAVISAGKTTDSGAMNAK